MEKLKLSRKLLTLVLSLTLVISSLPLSIAYAAEDGKMADVVAITNSSNATVDDSDKSSVTIKYDDSVNLDWDAKNPSVGRNQDGWWVGIKIIAPTGNDGYSVSELKEAKYQTCYYGYSEFSADKSFWNAQDSAVNDDESQERYIGMWAFINESVLNKAINNGENIINKYKFDWNNDGTFEQTVDFEINPEKVNLYKTVDGNKEKVYPSNDLASVSVYTQADKMTVSGSKTNNVSVSNNQKITLQWSQADPSVGRGSDNWWAGIKVVAPSNINVAALKNAKYRTLYYGYTEWSGAKSFWNSQDSDPKSDDENIERFIGMWISANDSVIEKAKNNNENIDYKYEFDWDGDGVYEQTLKFFLNPDEIELDPTGLYAMDKQAPQFVDTTQDATVWVNDKVEITGKAIDAGTESNGKTYISGTDKVEYARGSKTAKRETATFDADTNEFSFTVTDEFLGKYYIFATDKAGNESSYEVLVKLDNQKPELSDVAADISDWTNSGVTISGDASDTLSGVEKVTYKLGDDTTEKEATFVSNDGGKTGKFEIALAPQNFDGKVYITATDNSGLKSETTEVSVKMDNESCVIVSADASSTEWTNGDVIVTGAFSDNLSGVKDVKYKKNGTDEWISAENINYSNDNQTEGTFSFKIEKQNYEGDYLIYCVDKANNSSNPEDVKVSVKMDNEPPVIDDAAADPNEWTKNDVVIKGYFSDNLSGITSVKYKRADADDSAYSDADIDTSQGTFSFTVNKQDYSGKYIIYCTDDAGNKSEKFEVAVSMDVTAPSDVTIEYSDSIISRILSGVTFGFYKEKCNVTLKSNDNLSGVKSFTYSYVSDDTAKVTVDETVSGFSTKDGMTEYKFAVSAPFRDKIKASATDKAGNSTADKVEDTTVVVDDTPAEITAKITTNPVNTNNGVKYFNGDVNIEIAIKEANFMPGEYPNETVKPVDVEVKCDGKKIDKPFNINWEKSDDSDIWKGVLTLKSGADGVAPDGKYEVSVKYTDESGNESDTVTINNFVIDTVSPIVEIKYNDNVNENRADKGYFTNRTATVTVEERNFDAGVDYIKASLTAKDINSNNVKTKAQEKLAKINDYNAWSHNGDIHTFTIDYTDDAIYSFSFDKLTDNAKHNCIYKNGNNSVFDKNAETPENFAVDKSSPKIEVSTSDAFAYRIINALTFGFFANKVDVNITVKDSTSGLQKLNIKSSKTDGSVGEFEKTNLTKDDAEKISQDGQYCVYEYKFAIDYDYKDSINVNATDNSGNSASAQTVKNAKDENYNGIVVDTKNPEIPSYKLDGVKNTVNDINYFANDVKITYTVDEDYFYKNYYSSVKDAADGKNVIDALKNDVSLTITKIDDNDNEETYYEGSASSDDANGLFTSSFDETNKQIGITIPSVIGDKKNDGKYKISLTYKDLTGHTATIVTDNLVIDTTAPVIETTYSNTVNEVKDADTNKVIDYYNADNKPEMLIKVTERNFNAENFVSEISGVNVQNSKSTDAENFFANYLKNDENWQHIGNTHTVRVPLENFELNYIINFDYQDEAGNAADKPEAKYLTYDASKPSVELSVNSSLIRKVLNGITFGIFDKAVDANVTITADDSVSGIETIAYLSEDVDGKIGSVKNELSVKNPLVNNGTSSDGVEVEESNRKIVFKFTVPAEYRNGLSAKVTDYSKNSNSVKTIVNAGDASISYDGIIKDKVAPTVKISVDPKAAYASENTFPSDFNYHIDVNDNNSGIGQVEVKLNGTTVAKDANGNNINEYYDGNNLVSGFSFDINTSQLENHTSDGVYLLEVSVADNAGNKGTNKYEAYIDTYAPMISEFTFESRGNVYSGDEAIKASKGSSDKKVNGDIQKADSTAYEYYFEKNTYVTVSACDYDKNGENKHTSGIKDIKLIAESATGEEVNCSPVSDSFVQTTKSGVGYSKKTFLVKGPFKGNLYAIAEDYAGNYPTNNQSKGNVLSNYKSLMSSKYEGYVNPNGAILEDSDKHSATSRIVIKPQSKPTATETYNYSYKYDSNAQKDAAMDYTESKVPLYNGNAKFNITVSDTYSGIREISWSVLGQSNQDTANNQNGTVKVNNLGSISGDSGWTSTKEQNSNLVTSMTKNITVKNNSNDIVLLVELTDRAGNKSYDYYVLGIDKTNPSINISVSGTSANGKYFNTGRTVTVVVKERNFNPKEFDLIMSKNETDISKNGSKLKWTHSNSDKNASDDTTHTATYTIGKSQEGDYKLSAKAVDLATNKNNKVAFSGSSPKNFIIDSTKPIVNVSMTGTSANEKYFFNTDRTVKIEITDRNFDPNDVTVLINGSKRNIAASAWKHDQSGSNRTNSTKNTTEFTISAEADYTFSVTCNDLAENSAGKTKYSSDDCEKFTIDKTAPTIVITQMVYQSANNGKNEKGEKTNIPITVTVKDNNIGNMYNNNAITSKEVIESLNVSALNGETKASSFGVHDSSRTAVVYSSSNLKEDGIYRLNLNVKDCAGNPVRVVTYTASKSGSTSTKNISNGATDFFTFSVNRNGSTYSVDDNTRKLVEKYYVQHVENDVVIYEVNVNELKGDLKKNIRITDSNGNELDASDFINVSLNRNKNNWYRYAYTISKSFFDSEREYIINVESKDAADNKGYSSLKMKDKSNLAFVVDRTKPVVTINGVTSDKVYTKDSQHVKVTVSDDVLLSKIAIYINGDKNPIIELNAKDFGDYYVDGQFVWEYDFKESGSKQQIEVKCWDAADNNNISGDPETGDLVENFLVSTNVKDQAKFWIVNHVLLFVIICVAIIGIAVIIILLINSKKRKKDEE